MITALIFILIWIGGFEIWVYRQSHQEEDLYIIGFCFVAAGFLTAMTLGGAW